ncbi:Salicylate hydroxylase [Mariniradius saccharolyticus AK6]|uniref:Salicylate hydroxylase n=1 Tax=Mariniradius saccharolyticus AK6 TaxID=1239962 RepID=M7XF02_9BACT|nr:FAD-dependent monooxygenase [Mariniradius saccharolyticus]EMS33128.1 Salicylate hydroxylase [Mariniradius saccharolyticus AK6]
MKTDFLIVGGGIAGLTTAIALKKIGIHAILAEASPEIRAVGAGLALAANAMQALRQIGISEAVIPLGRELKAFTIYDQKGKPISKTNTDPANSRFGISNFTIHRAALHSALLARLDAGQVLTGKRSKDIAEEGDAYRVDFEDGSSITAENVIVAEGIHSPIRKKLLPTSKIRYAGYTCWRGITDNPSLQIEETSETWGAKGRFGVTPLANGQVYWYACINSPHANSTLKDWGKKELMEVFKDFHTPIPQVLSATRPERIIWNDILDLEPIDRFAFGRIVLVGDAAHATTPNMGQGACMAIEDAAVLASCLSKNTDVAEAFSAFEKRRLKRTHNIVKTSWTLGKVAQWENSLLRAIRDKAFRMIPAKQRQKQIEALYAVDLG